MSSAFFHAERSLALMTLLTQYRLAQIYQALNNQYACHHESKLTVCFYDSRCFCLLCHMQDVSKIADLKVIVNRKKNHNQVDQAVLRLSLEREVMVEIGHSVANSLPPLRHFLKRSCVAWAQ